jgi:hypothetical protein
MFSERTSVGLDVHARTTTAWALDGETGEVRRAGQGNRRLHQCWEGFPARKKNTNVAAVAVARELAGWCWSLAVMAADIRLTARRRTTRLPTSRRSHSTTPGPAPADPEQPVPLTNSPTYQGPQLG